MSNVAEIRPLTQKRKTGSTSPSQAQTPFTQAQQAMNELPQYIRMLNKQMAVLQNIAKEQLSVAKKQAATEQCRVEWMERLHDRMDSLIVESRVTNMLLSELIALQRLVLPEDTDESREAIRNDVYNRILNGE